MSEETGARIIFSKIAASKLDIVSAFVSATQPSDGGINRFIIYHK